MNKQIAEARENLRLSEKKRILAAYGDWMETTLNEVTEYFIKNPTECIKRVKMPCKSREVVKEFDIMAKKPEWEFRVAPVYNLFGRLKAVDVYINEAAYMFDYFSKID